MNIQTKQARVSKELISIDTRVQRVEGCDERRVNKIASNFNPRALGSITLSRRDDNTYVCLDGRHRWTAAQQVGYTGKLPAIVHEGLTLDEEAELFLLLNDFKAPSLVSKFLVRVVQGDEVAVKINNILSRHGWRVMNGASHGYLNAIGAVEAAYINGAGSLNAGEHPEVLERVIATITAAWGHETAGAHSTIIKGLAQLYGRFGDAVNIEKLAREMCMTTPARLVGNANTLKDVQGGTAPSAMAKVLVGMHNNTLRKAHLPEWVWTR